MHILDNIDMKYSILLGNTPQTPHLNFMRSFDDRTPPYREY